MLCSRLSKLQKSHKVCAFAKPTRTHWGSLQKCMETVLDSKAILHNLVCERDFIGGTAAQNAERTRIKYILIDLSFKTNLNESLELLRPIEKRVVKYESDCCSVSKILPHFTNGQRS